MCYTAILFSKLNLLFFLDTLIHKRFLKIMKRSNFPGDLTNAKTTGIKPVNIFFRFKTDLTNILAKTKFSPLYVSYYEQLERYRLNKDTVCECMHVDVYQIKQLYRTTPISF